MLEMCRTSVPDILSIGSALGKYAGLMYIMTEIEPLSNNQLLKLFTLNAEERIEARKKGIIKKSEKEAFLRKKNKFFWDKNDLNHGLRLCKDAGLLLQRRNRGPWEVGSDYALLDEKLKLARTFVESSPRDTKVLFCAGLVCNFPGYKLSEAEEKEINAIHGNANRLIDRLERLRFNLLLRIYLGDPNETSHETMGKSLASLIYYMLQNYYELGRKEEKFKFHFEHTSRKGIRELLNWHPLSYMDGSYSSLITGRDWDALYGVIRKYGSNYDWALNELIGLKKRRYDRFVEELEKPMVTVLMRMMMLKEAEDEEEAQEVRELTRDYARAYSAPDRSLEETTAAIKLRMGEFHERLAPACSGCGKPTVWIAAYERYYCYPCKKYASKTSIRRPARSRRP